MGYRFARAPRWVALHAVVLALVAAFVSLALWQLRRLEDRRDANARIAARLSIPDAPIEAVVPDPDRARPADLAWRRALARGTFDAAREVVILSRGFRGISGHRVLTPLVTRGGRALLVDRGWFPITFGDRPPVAEAPPPPGEVLASVILFPSERRGRFGPRETREGALASTFRIDVERLRAQFPYPVYPVYAQMRSSTPASPEEHPIPVPPPPLDEGPHLSYAIQWMAFAAIVVVGYPAVLRAASRRSARSSRSRPSQPDQTTRIET